MMDMQEIESILYDLDAMVELAKQRCNTPRFLEIVHSAIEIRRAVEKQIPKKPEYVDYDMSYYKCGSCGELIAWTADEGDHKFCLECGQAIKWEDE